MSGSIEEPDKIESDREQTETTPADREAGVGRGASHRPLRIAKAAGAAIPVTVTTVVALAGLFFLLRPDAKPDERPVAKGGSLTIATLDRLTFGQYLDRGQVSRSEYPRAQLERAGALVRVNIEVTGYQGKRLPLRWRIVDARTGDQVQRSREDHYYIPYANKDENPWPIWVPLPRGVDRRFFVEVELFDDGGATTLGYARTERFNGA